jgi:hypothetical protein
MVAVVVLVLVVVIILRRLVSNNRMKRERKKTYVWPKGRRRRLLGPFFCLPEGGSGLSVARFSRPGGVLGVVYPPCCSLASLLRYVDH